MQSHFGRTQLRAETGGFVVSEVLFAPWEQVAAHAHDEPQLSAVIAGGMIETGSARTELRAASGAVFRPAGYTHRTDFFESETRGLVIELHDSRREIFHELREARQIDVPHVAHLYARIRHELTSSDAVSPLALEAAVLELISAAGRAMEPEDAIAHAVRSILRDPSKRWHASMFDIDDFATRFRSATGCTLPQFVLRSRVELAKRLLIESGAPIAEIAIECGFFDQAHFTRAFVQATGATPRRFRSPSPRA
jgi:AraC family transcriptional regulator